MTTLTNPLWIKAKGVLFLLLGILAAALILTEHADWPAAGNLDLVLLPLLLFCVLRN